MRNLVTYQKWSLSRCPHCYLVTFYRGNCSMRFNWRMCHITVVVNWFSYLCSDFSAFFYIAFGISYIPLFCRTQIMFSYWFVVNIKHDRQEFSFYLYYCFVNFVTVFVKKSYKVFISHNSDPFNFFSLRSICRYKFCSIWWGPDNSCE